MKRLLALLLLIPIAYSEVYYFSCAIDDSNIVASIKVDTDKKYMQLGDYTKFSKSYDETETSITAWNEDGIANYFRINKITGRAEQVYSHNGVSETYDYTCKAVIPLMP
jgi:uncharacterized protein YxeA